MFNITFPITHSLLYDFTLVVICLIVGSGIWLKGGSKWGILFVAAAVFWAVMLAKIVAGM